MRRKEKEVFDQSVIKYVFEKAQIIRIGMCLDNVPYVVPMNFGIIGDKLYMHCAKEGKKLDIIKKNNRVCFEIEADIELVKAEKACGWAMKYLSIIGDGEVKIVRTDDEKAKGLNAIMKKYSGRNDYEFSSEQMKNVEILEITINSLSCKKS